MRKLKLFFACLLMAVLSIGQVWATDETVTLSSGTYVTDHIVWSAAGGNITISQLKGNVTTAVNSSYISAPRVYKGHVLSFVAAAGYKINSIEITVNGTNYGNSMTAGTVYSNNIVTDNTTDVDRSWTTTSGGKHIVSAHETAGLSEIYIQNVASSANTQLRISALKITYTSTSSTPSVSVSPDSWNFGTVHASDAASKVFSVSGSNLTAGTLSISVPAGFSVSPSSISVTEATLAATNVTVSKNTTAIDDYSGNLSISATCGLTEAKTVALEMSVVADPEPTGTFEPFSGDIEEGDYLIVADGAGMNTTVSGNRLQYTALTLTGENYVNPDESVIWHIAESATEGYWTIYSGAESKYAAATGSNNQAQMLESGTDNKSLWEITHSEAVYTITNKSNSRFLKKNGTYGFACYADGTVSLYKKQVAGQPKAPTFSIPGGNYETAQSVELSCETQGAKIYYTLDGSKPSSTSTEYSTAIPVSATTTIKAVAIKDEIESTVATATYTIVVWQTVDEIWSSITSEGPTNANVWGYVSQANVGGYNNNYYISVDGSLTANQLEIYKGDNAGNTVAVGDKVHVNGDLTIFNEIKEFKQNTGVIVHYAAKGALQSVAIDGTPTKTEYAANEDFDPAGLKVYGTYANGFVGEITDGITWGNDLTDGKVTENTTVHVTATVSGITNDPAYDVPVTVAAKTLVSIAVGTAAYTIYTGEALPQPVVTATFSEGEPENVSAFAVYDSESVFDTEVIDDPDPQTITVSYTFGGATQTATYTVSVKDYANADDAPYTVTEALHIITDAIGNAESAREIVVTGTVSEENISNNKNRYKISDSTNELLVYAGKGFNNENFTNTNYPKVGDVVKVKGKVINYNNNTPEFASGKSYLLSQVRPATIAIENVASFEVGATDLTESDLDITTPSDGDITFVSGDDAVATIEANAIHAVAPGTVTITANLAATENVDALNYAATSTTFSVTVVAPATKYAITFSGNGATGGDAPEFASEAAAGANITLPANTYIYTGKVFDGWKVINNTTTEEVTVTAGAFLMPASAVTIQAQWAEPSVWATTYTSNVAIASSQSEKVIISSTEYDAAKANKGATATITLPMNTSKIHFHIVGWKDEAQTVSITGACFNEAKAISIPADAGVNTGSPYTLAGNAYDYYFSLTPDNAVAADEEITITAASGKRFVLFGVNQEGGIVPVLDHITITGTMTNTTGWKTGDNIVPEGLTVNAIYTLNNVEQTPVEVDPNDVVWSHAALTEGQTEVTLTASYTDGVEKTANTDVTIEAVETGDPTIITDPTTQATFTATERGAALPAAKTIAVTLKNITSATATLGGTNPGVFSLSKTTGIVDGDEISVSVVSTDIEVASYSATVTIKDASGDTQKSINIYLTIKQPEAVETPVSTSTKWVPATAITNGMQVLITGAIDDDIYAMGAQGGNNRTAVKGTVDGDVFTPGENTMAFTLIAQEGGTYAIQTSAGKYLYAGASNNNRLYTRDAIGDDNNANWTVAIGALVANGSNRGVMQFNSGLFNCYSTASQSPIKLYVQAYTVTISDQIENGSVVSDKATAAENEEVTLTITAEAGYELSVLTINGDDVASSVSGHSYSFNMPAEAVTVNATFSLIPTPATPDYTRDGLTAGNYATICLPNGGTISGATLFDLEYYDEGANTLYLLEVTGNAMEAGKPYVFLPSGTSIEVFYTDDANEPAGSFNGLVGSYSETTILANAGNYILWKNAYYFVDSQARVGANRAYIHMEDVDTEPSTPQLGAAPRRRVAMTVNGKDATQGFENLQSGDAPVKVMIEGTLYILRGEKVYDATGRLVK